MLAVTLPLAAAALAALSPSLVQKQVHQEVAHVSQTQWPQVHARTQAFLEPRGGEGPARLRQLSFRGRPVAFGEGELEAAENDGPSRPFVLKHTDVDAEVAGIVQSVTVTQEFENPFSGPVEAVYVFPLPDDAAVDEMTLTAGGRVIRAQIHKREQARRIYEEAKAQGRRAALLDQERPNIFTQSVANLLPHETVKVTLHYVAKLAYDDGEYTFNFPMTVGPRYIGGQALPGEQQGTGTHADTTQVIDASRITPPLQRTGRDISVRVRIDAGLPLEDLYSVSHRLQLESREAHQATVTLDPSDKIPNKDLILRWKVTGAEKRAAVLASGGEGGTFALMLAPESAEVHAAAVPKEMVFLIDTSCSMGGPPLEAAKNAMTMAMQQMGPNDTFMLIDFADSASAFHSTPLANTPMNVSRAVSYLQSLPASGGTNQLAGIHAALALAPDEKRVREVLLMTDGFIGDERSILAEEDVRLGSSRVFAFGVGTSVNHYLLSRMSTNGRGFYQYLRPDEDAKAAVSRFVKRINRPILTDVTVSASGTELFDLEPKQIPDLFDAQPLVVLGRYKNPGHVRFTVSAKQGRQPVKFDVEAEIPAQPGAGQGLRQLWARAKIEELDSQQHFGERGDVIGEITTLGLEHHLVTAYTSLVAVDDRVVARPGAPTVAVPTAKPELTVNGDVSSALGWDDKGIDGKDSWSQNGAAAPARAHTSTTRGGYITTKGRGEHEGDDFDTAFGGGDMKPAHHAVTLRDAMNNAKADPSVDVSGGQTGEVVGGVVGGKIAHKGAPDDDFDMQFGGGDHHATAKKDVYIPAASEPDETFSSPTAASIMQVVLSHKAELAQCADVQHKKDPKLTGKLVMRWRILANGKTSEISVVSEEFKGTPFATCLGALIKTWVFPKSAQAGDPIVFPFKF
ncbi:MAG: VIT domain-containing protein [Myxococcaceae bacterium]